MYLCNVMLCHAYNVCNGVTDAMYVCMYVYAYACMHVCAYIYIYRHTQTSLSYVYTVYTDVHMFTCMYIYIHVYVYIFINIIRIIRAYAGKVHFQLSRAQSGCLRTDVLC